MPKVSVIVPCFNQSEYLSEALESVLAQTYTDWECVIINDGSTDDTERIAKKYCAYDSRFLYIYQDNQGIVSARNNAINESKGEFVLPLDGDDRIGDTYLEKAVKIIEKDKSVKVVSTLAEYFGATNGPTPSHTFTFPALLTRNQLYITSLFRRKDFARFNENMRNGLEDWDFWISLLESGGRIECIKEVLFYYRIKDLSRNTNASKFHNDLVSNIVRNHPNAYYNEYCKLYEKYNHLIHLFPINFLLWLKKSLSKK